MTVHETAAAYALVINGICIAEHAKAARHTVVMEPAHYAGLLRPDGRAISDTPPRWDPAYRQLGDVMVRDLGIYGVIVDVGGAA